MQQRRIARFNMAISSAAIQAWFIRPVARIAPSLCAIWVTAKIGKEHKMVRSIFLSGALAFGLATAANAGIITMPAGNSGSLVVKVAEGCGPGFWRGPQGRCHPMAMNRACPPGYHLGPEGRKCWPN
jgi:hypothetical protein